MAGPSQRPAAKKVKKLATKSASQNIAFNTLVSKGAGTTKELGNRLANSDTKQEKAGSKATAIGMNKIAVNNKTALKRGNQSANAATKKPKKK